MPGLRTLWTGPCGVDPRALVIKQAARDASAVWLVPTPLARDQIRRSLAIAANGAVTNHRVWTWTDVWRAVASAHGEPPARPSRAGLRAILTEAIRRARAADALGPLGTSLGFEGFRRLMLDRFAAWSGSERSPDKPPASDTPAGRAEWALFGYYRAVLDELGAVDPPGWAAWASRELGHAAPPGLRKPNMVIVVDPVRPGRAAWRVLDHCQQRAKAMFVLLPWTDEPALGEVYAVAGATRKRFLDWGFQEEISHPDWFRPPGLRAIENEVFRSDGPARPWVALQPDQGLCILGGPEGDGLALLVARTVQRALRGDSPLDPDDVLILVPRLDSAAESIRSTLGAWGLPVAEPPTRPLRSFPALSALRRLIRLPVDGWEVASLARLLRNGLIHWDRVVPGAMTGRFDAASALRATRVFRDRVTLRRALERPKPDGPDRPGGREARAIVDALAALIDPIARPGTWRQQTGRLRRLARHVGLDGPDLEPLWDALDDVGWVHDGLGPRSADEVGSWAEFVDEVDALAASGEVRQDPPASGCVRIEPVDAVVGARARLVILANLAERTFPAPAALDLSLAEPTEDSEDAPVLPFTEDFDDEEGEPTDTQAAVASAFAREMFRFVRVSGMADDRLVLAYPTTNLNGEPLLPAGFLDDVVRRLDGGYDAPVVERHQRFDPVLLGHDDLAVAPADRRILAVARACRDFAADNGRELRRLVGEPGPRSAWLGTAAAFEVADARHRDRRFGAFDGLLTHPQLVAELATRFGPDHSFSASQLESFALCPFQFFLRYALGLKPVDERRELDEDYAGRGSDIHRILETVHRTMATETPEAVHDRLGELIAAAVERELQPYHDSPGDVAQVLSEIGARRTEKILGRYQSQFKTYVSQWGTPRPHQFEVVFGQPDKDDSLPHLTLGEGGQAVRFQGVIDRIDLVESNGTTTFRVIDYKTGSNPSRDDVLTGRASQLPLYALAVEQLVLPGWEHATPDVGYWSLPRQGFKPIKLQDWESYRQDLVEFVLEIVARLRGGSFPIESRLKDCVKVCDFRAICRVHQVRRAGKVWDHTPMLGGRIG